MGAEEAVRAAAVRARGVAAAESMALVKASLAAAVASAGRRQAPKAGG